MAELIQAEPIAELSATPALHSSPSGPRWRYWLSKGTLAIIDQALFSGSNFVFSILLARWLSGEEYGAYAVTFAVFMLLATVHQALLLVPSLILGSTLYKDRRRGYLGAMIRLHTMLSLCLSGGLALATLVTYIRSPESPLVGSFAGLALALPCVLLYWLARSAWYLDLAPGGAAAAAFLYCVLLLSGVWLSHQTGLASAFTGFVVMTVASLTLSIALLWRLKPVVWSQRGRVSTKEVWQESWIYGRWELAIAIAIWLPVNLCYPLTAGIIGISGAGALRAMQNLTLPIGHAVGAVLRLAQPYLSSRYGGDGRAGTTQSVKQLAVLAMIGTGIYFLVVSLLRRPILAALYGDKFGEAVDWIPWILLGLVFSAGAEGLGVGLRAMRSSMALFCGYLAAGLFFALTGAPAARASGLAGVVTTLVAANIITFFAIGYVFYRKSRTGTNMQKAVEL